MFCASWLCLLWFCHYKFDQTVFGCFFLWIHASCRLISQYLLFLDDWHMTIEWKLGIVSKFASKIENFEAKKDQNLGQTFDFGQPIAVKAFTTVRVNVYKTFLSKQTYTTAGNNAEQFCSAQLIAFALLLPWFGPFVDDAARPCHLSSSRWVLNIFGNFMEIAIRVQSILGEMSDKLIMIWPLPFNQTRCIRALFECAVDKSSHWFRYRINVRSIGRNAFK